jgi:hypothetical protein
MTWDSACRTAVATRKLQRNKSFLLLFFKKEALAYFLTVAAVVARITSRTSTLLASSGTSPAMLRNR